MGLFAKVVELLTGVVVGVGLEVEVGGEVVVWVVICEACASQSVFVE